MLPKNPKELINCLIIQRSTLNLIRFKLKALQKIPLNKILKHSLFKNNKNKKSYILNKYNYSKLSFS